MKKTCKENKGRSFIYQYTNYIKILYVINILMHQNHVNMQK